MAAPEKFFDYDFLDDGYGQDIQWVAPQIGSALTPLNLNAQDQGVNTGWVFEWSGSDLGGLYGARKPLPAARDISTRRFLWVGAFTNQFATNMKFADIADGGVRFYLTDSVGAYWGFTLYGRDVTGNEPNPAFAFGSFIAFNNSPAQMWWCIDLARTPDYSSGTLDLTDIVAVEAHVKNNAVITNTNNGKVGFGYLLASGNNIIRAGEVADPADLTLLPQSLAVWSASNPLFPGGGRQGQALTPIYDGANGNNYATMCPVHIGDGSTATYFRQGRGTLSAQLSMEAIKYRIAQGDVPSLLPCYMPDDNGNRTHTINQSASDDVEIADFTWSDFDFPAKGYAVEVTGSTSGTCAFLRNTFARPQFVRLRHATATDCIFDAAGYVEIDANTAMTGSTIRNAEAGSSALIVTGAAGNYSAIDVRLNNPSATHDVVVGGGGAGTYDLSGLTVPAGYTLKVHNASASNAVTVQVAAGITTSTTTAGGSITVTQPPNTYTLQLPNILAGSRYQIVNTTTDTELANAIVGASGIDVTYTLGTDFSANDSGRVRITYQNGTTAKAELQIGFTFPAATSTNSIPEAQVDDEVYNALALDGSTFTGVFSADYTNNEIDILVGSNFNVADLYAWWVYNLTTEDGIREFYGGITAVDQANFRVNAADVSVFIDNTTATNIRQLDNRRFYRSDGAYPVKTPGTGTGGIDIVWRNTILLAETGVSGLTPEESAQLASLPSAATIATSVWDKDVSTYVTSNQAGTILKTAESNTEDLKTTTIVRANVVQVAASSVSGVNDFKADVTGLATAEQISDQIQSDLATEIARIDVAISSREASGAAASASTNVTVGDVTTSALTKFVTSDTGETAAAAGSVAKLSQGGDGSSVTVTDISQAALAKFASVDTGETEAVDGSVAKLAQATDVNVAGPGVVSVDITLQESDGTPITSAAVWVSTDEAGSNIIAGTLYTNAFGTATFLLDPGVYYRWASKAGVNFTNPQIFEVTA